MKRCLWGAKQKRAPIVASHAGKVPRRSGSCGCSHPPAAAPKPTIMLDFRYIAKLGGIKITKWVHIMLASLEKPTNNEVPPNNTPYVHNVSVCAHAWVRGCGCGCVCGCGSRCLCGCGCGCACGYSCACACAFARVRVRVHQTKQRTLKVKESKSPKFASLRFGHLWMTCMGSITMSSFWMLDSPVGIGSLNEPWV